MRIDKKTDEKRYEKIDVIGFCFTFVVMATFFRK